MKNSIKFKFTLGLSIIFLISGIALNILIRHVFEKGFENTVESSISAIIHSSKDYIYYKFSSNDLYFDEKNIDIMSLDILQYFTFTHNCDSQIRDSNGKIIESNIIELYKRVPEKVTKGALDNKVLLVFEYYDKKVSGTFAYPLYYKEKMVGIITIRKDFSKLYFYNKKLVNLITYAEVGILITIFILSFIFISRLIHPITILTRDVKKVGEGDYENTLDIKSSDEIGVLSNEFMKMKRKIKEQIDTIIKEKEKVMKLEKVRTEFFNNVTHELKTPLTGISCYAQILLEEFESEDEFKKRAVKRIYMESERLHNLVLDLIDISKGISLIEEEDKEIDMAKLLNEICDDMETKACKHSLTLCRCIEKGYIIGKANKIRQVLINIIDNAIKYSYTEEDMIYIILILQILKLKRLIE